MIDKEGNKTCDKCGVSLGKDLTTDASRREHYCTDCSFKPPILKHINTGFKFLEHQKRLLYFAHPFDTWRTDKERRIEEYLTKRGYRVINPFKEENRLNEKYGVDNYYDNPTKSFAEDIVEKDWEMVQKCDEYFGWYPRGISVIGTPIELMWALLLRKKITCLCYKPQPFLIMYSNVLYTSYLDFVENKPEFTQNKIPSKNILKFFGFDGDQYDHSISR